MLMEQTKKRYTFSTHEKPLPLFIESIGFNPQEEDFARPEGYPYYHWLQTIAGEGCFSFNGEEYLLSPGKGIFLTPFTPHSYYTTGEKWSTLYVTFGGAAVNEILDSLEIHYSALYAETKENCFSDLIIKMMHKVEENSEFSRLELSEDLYRFIMMLKKSGKAAKQPSISNYYKMIKMTVDWLEKHYSDDIGLKDIAEYAGVSSQYLNSLFRETFHTSPYSFLIQLRIREAKRILLANPELSLKEVAHLVGFKDPSHFGATFKRIEKMTPKKYRKLFKV